MAIAFGASSSNVDGGVSSISVSHTATGSDRIALIGVAAENEVTITSVTYGGSACSLVRQHSNTASGVNLYRFLAPATSAQTVQANFSGVSGRIGLAVVSYTGVDQTTPLGTAVDGESATSPVSVVASSAAGELVVDWAWVIGTTITVGAGQTSRAENDDTLTMGRSFGMSEEAGAASVTMSWSYTDGTSEGFIIAVPLKPASGGGGGTPPSLNRRFGPQSFQRTLVNL